VAIYFNESIIYFLIPSLLSLFIGYLLYKLTNSIDIKLKHALIISALTWLLFSLIGALPFYFSVSYFNYLDSVFESMSAWTTTGFTLINNVEILPHSIQFWRSVEQWIGGIGVLVMVITILSKSGLYSYYKAEGRDEKILPSTKGTVKKIWQIYIVYTFVGIFLLYICGLSLWEAINICMCGISTGGMSISNSSFPYNNFAKIIMVTIMYIGGVISFSVHHKLLTGKYKLDIQTIMSIPIIVISSLLIMYNSNISLIDSIFTIVSAMTSTGYSTVNISNFNIFSIGLLIIIMMIGGSAGTTTGGIKLIRLAIILKTYYYKILKSILPPNTIIVEKLNYNNKIINKDIVNDSYIIASFYFIHYLFGWLLLMFLEYDGFKSLFESVSLAANIGLSVGIVNDSLNPIGKIFGIFLMWVGRLELIPVYVLILLPYILCKKNKNKNKI